MLKKKLAFSFFKVNFFINVGQNQRQDFVELQSLKSALLFWLLKDYSHQSCLVHFK